MEILLTPRYHCVGTSARRMSCKEREDILSRLCPKAVFANVLLKTNSRDAEWFRVVQAQQWRRGVPGFPEVGEERAVRE